MGSFQAGGDPPPQITRVRISYGFVGRLFYTGIFSSCKIIFNQNFHFFKILRFYLNFTKISGIGLGLALELGLALGLGLKFPFIDQI